ncbi:SDR family oxidoreductase [Streptomyces sp. NBC_01320]|uniref:SDR family oxidoreductase n=1 Tax=Streptomyces sp. NBC_01320 TaxID=2903824 RepID=UPI002E15E5A5|nr:NAD(P)H-binding protein [Streptomyces sp. NBC_01320]
MKFAVIGGTGLIGSLVVKNLNAAGHQAVPHSLSTGVDIITGQGLDDAVADADTVINLTNSPTFDDASPAFFQTSMDNLLAASEKGRVGHFVILSIVGMDQVPDLDYYRAKVLQEDILKAGPLPYSIVRATQFMEFIDAVMSETAEGETVRLPRTPLQPIAAADVARVVAEVAAGTPLNGVLHIAGPDVYPLDELGRLTLTAKGDRRSVVTDDTAGMFAAVHGDVLTARNDARIAPTHYTDWLS